MNNAGFGRVLSAIAFLGFASISCWATAESLYLSLAGAIPLVVCYGIAIGFFVVASLGTKLIVDSLNDDVAGENRGWTLFGGIVLTIIFWLVCSMPTNTHTFIYRAKHEKVFQTDVLSTIGYLEQLKNNVSQKNRIKDVQNQYSERVQRAARDLRAEIMNPLNPGFGPSSREKLIAVSEALGGQPVAELSRASDRRLSTTERNRLASAYDEIIEARREEHVNFIADSITKAETSTFQKEAKNALKPLYGQRDAINEGEVDYYDADEVALIKTSLQSGYEIIGKYPDFISFDEGDSKDRYTQETIVTRVEGVLDVLTVWKDMLKGKYNGSGLWYWIILAILVDIAAFIFFDIAFAKRED